MSMPVRDVNLGRIQAEVERRADGTQIVRSNQPLPKYPDKLTARLDHWATVTPKRTFIAQRGPDGDWRQLTYEDARDRARGIGQALMRAMNRERVLSGLARARAEGKQLGRRRVEQTSANKVAAVHSMLQRGVGVRKIAAQVGLGIGTVLRLRRSGNCDRV
jgi:hypothetical protein